MDIRSLGSGNAGATNAGRVLGRHAYLLVLLGDAIKGALAVALGARIAALLYALTRNLQRAGAITLVAAPIMAILLGRNAYVVGSLVTAIALILVAHRDVLRAFVRGGFSTP